MKTWRITPILRWSFKSRRRLFATANSWLGQRHIGPDGAWAKVMPSTEALWNRLINSRRAIGDITAKSATAFKLEIASTPRYYISASRSPMRRSSKHTLYFETEATLDLAYLILNSTLPYWWWRTIAGGISLTRQTLLTVPIPDDLVVEDSLLLDELRISDQRDRTIKMNAGKANENVKRPWDLTRRINSEVFADSEPDFRLVYAPDMFADVDR